MKKICIHTDFMAFFVHFMNALVTVMVPIRPIKTPNMHKNTWIENPADAPWPPLPQCPCKSNLNILTFHLWLAAISKWVELGGWDWAHSLRLFKLFPNFTFLGANKRLYKRLRWSVCWLVGPSVGRSVPTMQLYGKLVTSQLLREEEKEEDTDYVVIPLRRGSFAPRD
jgi:hypothetical protein